MEDELYLENIDEFVTDQNRVVSPHTCGWGGALRALPAPFQLPQPNIRRWRGWWRSFSTGRRSTGCHEC